MAAPRERACDVYVVIAKEERRAAGARARAATARSGQARGFPAHAPRRSANNSRPPRTSARAAPSLVGDEWPQVKVKTLATREEREVGREEIAGLV